VALQLPSDVRLSVPCTTSPAPDAAVVRHSVTLTADWALLTPHDLDAERIGAAFGGYLSCLVVADALVPALRRWWGLQARVVLPPVRRAARGTWRPTPSAAASCCRSEASAAEAVAHLRSTEHLAQRVGLSPRFIEPFCVTLAAPDLLPDEAARLAARCVTGAGGLLDLWRAGLHPQVVRSVHDSVVGPSGPPLPPALYLGAVTRRPDLAWVADTLQAVHDASPEGMTEHETGDLAQWLAWTQTGVDRRHREARADWLILGVPRGWVAELAASGYTPDDAARLGAATGRGVVGAVHMLRAWTAAGCTPTVPDLVALHSEGVPAWYQPSGAAVSRLVDAVADLDSSHPRTQLGLTLARHGTVAAAEQAVRRLHISSRKAYA
jgi:hypothetical protein